DTLPAPKSLTGPDLGVAALTYRAWHEAKFGEAHWQKLHKIPRFDWAAYLMWLRETVGLPVENEIEVRSLELVPGAVRAKLDGETIYARKIVLAMGREGTGTPRWPGFRTSKPGVPNVFHSADDIDFSALKAKRVAILGAGASAFDNAAETLDARAKEGLISPR